MTSLSDLRDTLDAHAESVPDAEATARLSAVHHRVAVVRRRRRAVGTGALALVLLGGAALAWVPRLTGDGALPAAPVVLGQKAPTTQHSFGYTYRTDGHGESFARSGSLEVRRSDEPQLYSWTTDGDSRVTVRTPGREEWHSDVSGFRDYVVVPPGTSGRLEVSVERGRVGLASYDLTDAVPSGAYSKDGITFRPEAAGAPLLRAVVSDRGQTEVTTSFVVPAGPVDLHLVCTGLPKHVFVHVLVGGRESEIGDAASCVDATEFDPASLTYSTQPRVGRPGSTQTVSILVTGGFHDRTPLPVGSAPDLQLGLGVYGPARSVQTGAGRVPRVVEHGGHSWSLSTVAARASGHTLTLVTAPVDRVAEVALHTRGTTLVDFRAGSWRATEGTGGAGGLGGFFAPAGAEVHVALTEGTGRYGVALYERTD